MTDSRWEFVIVLLAASTVSAVFSTLVGFVLCSVMVVTSCF